MAAGRPSAQRASGAQNAARSAGGSIRTPFRGRLRLCWRRARAARRSGRACVAGLIGQHRRWGRCAAAAAAASERCGEIWAAGCMRVGRSPHQRQVLGRACSARLKPIRHGRQSWCALLLTVLAGQPTIAAGGAAAGGGGSSEGPRHGSAVVICPAPSRAQTHLLRHQSTGSHGGHLHCVRRAAGLHGLCTLRPQGGG